ncbi:MAG: hypothetical protein ACREFR_08000, partial [Limisphaerales bacterium]
MIALENLPDAARQAFEGLQSQIGCLEQSLQHKEQIIQDKEKLLRLKDEQIRLLNFRFFGPKSEKLSPNQRQLLLAEVSLTLAEVEQEAQRPEAEKESPPPKARPARPNHRGREPLPAHLERREVIVPCHPQDCHCSQCGAQRPLIGYETREELACDPAKFYVRVIKREKRGSHCLPEQGVATAPVPPQIMPKGKLSNEFI